jgi:hypothetical protein
MNYDTPLMILFALILLVGAGFVGLKLLYAGYRWCKHQSYLLSIKILNQFSYVKALHIYENQLENKITALQAEIEHWRDTGFKTEKSGQQRFDFPVQEKPVIQEVTIDGTKYNLIWKGSDYTNVYVKGLTPIRKTSKDKKNHTEWVKDPLPTDFILPIENFYKKVQVS